MNNSNESNDKNLTEIIWLDLNKVNIFGFEMEKDIATVARMVRNVESGADFPPVYVTKIDDKNYILSGYEVSEENNYGGHHRALAHWIVGKPLKCIMTENYWKGKYNCNGNIKDIKLDHIDYWAYLDEICR